MKVIYKNRISEVAKLGQDIAQFGKEYKLNEQTVYTLNLCLEEIISNIILYGFPDSKEHTISLDIHYQAEPAQVLMRIEDEGIAFNPLQDTPCPPLESSLAERKQGGLGLYLVKKLMHSILYARENNANILKIIKYL